MMRNQNSDHPKVSFYKNHDRIVDRQVYPCSVCGNDCYQRCTKCQVMYYCSTRCQKIDWKAGHKRSCNRIGPTTTATTTTPSMVSSGSSKLLNPQIALTELCALAKKIPLDVSIQQMSQAQQHVERLLQQQQHQQRARNMRMDDEQNDDDEEEEEKMDTSGADNDGDDEDDGKLMPTRKTTTIRVGQSRNTNRTEQNNVATTVSKTTSDITIKDFPTSSNLPNVKTTITPLPSSSSSTSCSISSDPSTSPTSLPLPSMKKNVSFVVEEMSQIGRYQLTLRIPTAAITHEQSNDNLRLFSRRMISFNHDDDSTTDSETALPEITVSTIATTPSKSHTIVIVREKDTTTTTTTNSSSSSCSRQNGDHGSDSMNEALFVGEFPRPIVASQITWHIQECDEDQQQEGRRDDHRSIGATKNNMMVLCLRLPFPLDPSSLLFDNSIARIPSGKTSLVDVNAVVCGSCHLPLLMTTPSSLSTPEGGRMDMNGGGRIIRVLPTPVGHWDDIADTLICYSGQPYVDFTSASICAQPSVAFQDANVLCFHSTDVGNTVCVLAVENYGEAASMMMGAKNGTGMDEDDGKRKDDDVVKFGDDNNDDRQEISTGGTVVPQSTLLSSTPAVASREAVKGGGGNDHSWRNSTGTEGSVSLCCSRCCSPLGFAPLTSPDTWRFWKHRLSTRCSQDVPIEEGKNQFEQAALPPSNDLMPSPFAVVGPTPSRLVVKPLSSCSSFLARELVRYAESKAVFTFVIQCEQTKGEAMDNKKSHRKRKNCLLLRLLSWETSIATSFVNSSVKTSPTSPALSSKMEFEKVAKIVYEEAVDPTTILSAGYDQNVIPDGTTAHHQQWIWGGVDLCCAPEDSRTSTSIAAATTAANSGRLSAVRLQLPPDEYLTVLQDLKLGSHFFSKDVMNATMLMKMGGVWEGLGLSALFIQGKQ